jgi:hypothetical protein
MASGASRTTAIDDPRDAEAADPEPVSKLSSPR